MVLFWTEIEFKKKMLKKMVITVGECKPFYMSTQAARHGYDFDQISTKVIVTENDGQVYEKPVGKSPSLKTPIDFSHRGQSDLHLVRSTSHQTPQKLEI